MGVLDFAFDSASSSTFAVATGALALSLAALTRSGRALLLSAPATAYVRLLHDPVPISTKEDDTAQGPPIIVCGVEDERPVYLSHSALSRLFKTLGGKSRSEQRAEDGLRDASGTGKKPWVRICDFAAQADPAFWIPEEELSSWRRLSDDPADRALEALRQAHLLDPTFTPSVPADPLADILELHRRLNDPSSSTDTSDTHAQHLRAGLADFAAKIHTRPPRGAGAISESWYAARDARFAAQHGRPRAAADALSPDELRAELAEEARVLHAAQQMFYKFVGPILLSLLHFSLAAGFSSPKIMSVLRQTGYLVPYRDVGSEGGLSPLERAAKQNQRTADRTWSRLLETTQFVLDVMQDVDALLPPALFADAEVRNGIYSQHQRRRDNTSQTQANDSDDSHSFYKLGEAQSAYLARVGGGRGWQSSTRVRLLHANVRHKILSSVRARQARTATMYDADEDASAAASASHANLYDEVLNGTPINQEDLLATLASFSSSPLLCIGRMGHYVTPQEREDYVSLWRHVGFYMGCEPALLRRCFGDARLADGFLFNVVGHLFPNISQSVTMVRRPPGRPAAAATGRGSDSGQVGTPVVEDAGVPELDEDAQEQDTLASLAILQACADRPPFFTTLQTHWALARHLLGPSLAGYLGIPPTPPLQKLSVDLSFIATRIPIVFSTFPLYPQALRARWEYQRLRLGRIMMRRLINWLYGAGSRSAGDNDGHGAVAGQLATFTGRAGAKDRVGIELNPREGKAYARAWRMLMLEMGAVLAGWGLVGAVGSGYLASLAWTAYSGSR